MKSILFWFYLVRVLVFLIGCTFILNRWSWWLLVIIPIVLWLADQVHHILWEWDRELNRRQTMRRRKAR